MTNTYHSLFKYPQNDETNNNNNNNNNNIKLNIG